MNKTNKISCIKKNWKTVYEVIEMSISNETNFSLQIFGRIWNTSECTTVSSRLYQKEGAKKWTRTFYMLCWLNEKKWLRKTKLLKPNQSICLTGYLKILNIALLKTKMVWNELQDKGDLFFLIIFPENIESQSDKNTQFSLFQLVL